MSSFREDKQVAFVVATVVGARPNFMKAASLIKEMEGRSELSHILIHTEQHYDDEMSNIFFEHLKMRRPDISLGVGSGSHGEQTAKIILGLEKVLSEVRPHLVIVVGDVNSTMAGAIVASKALVPVAHVEAGLRSFDRSMPEEINRVVTDALSSLLFTTEESANENLIREGIEPEKIHFVGNVMIDTLLKFKEHARLSPVLTRLGLEEKDSGIREYAVLTLHRPSNVDLADTFIEVLDGLEEICKLIPVIFPVHPRTRLRLSEFGLWDRASSIRGLKLIEPLGYLDFLKLMTHARFVLTDSGGIQEETTVLNIPCLTIRENTERPVTISMGTNILVGPHREKIVAHSLDILAGRGKSGRVPPLWDGRAAGRIVRTICEFLNQPQGPGTDRHHSTLRGPLKSDPSIRESAPIV